MVSQVKRIKTHAEVVLERDRINEEPLDDEVGILDLLTNSWFSTWRNGRRTTPSEHTLSIEGDTEERAEIEISWYELGELKYRCYYVDLATAQKLIENSELELLSQVHFHTYRISAAGRTRLEQHLVSR